VLSANASTTTKPSVLSQGMTDTQRKILWKLLIELFLDRPQTIRSSGEEKEEKE
jgi:hypothetical protein